MQLAQIPRIGVNIGGRETVEGEVHGVGGDQPQGNILKGKLLGGVVHSVDMAKVAGGITVGVEGIHKGAADEIQPHGREVQKHRNGRGEAVLRLAFPLQGHRAVQGELQTDDLAVDDLLVVHRAHRHLLPLVQKPPAGAADDLVLHQIGVIIENAYRGYVVVLKKSIHFRGSRPPEIVVALADDLLAGKRIYEFHIGKRFLKGQRPGNISGNNNRILRANNCSPVFFYPFGVICPILPENFHRFICFFG